MLLTLAAVAAIIWLVACGVFLGLVPDAETPREEDAVVADASVSAQPVISLPKEVPAPDYGIDVPVALLLHRLEKHIRHEEAAARNYIEQPSAANLHAPTDSMMVN